MNIASLFNLGGPDLLIILVIVLLLFGAKKLPELAKGLGQAVREFSKAKDEFEREVTRPVEPPVQRLAPPQTEPVSPAASTASHDPHDPHAEQQSQDHTTVI
jgi:sec-independent protein translocase protein TatA